MMKISMENVLFISWMEFMVIIDVNGFHYARDNHIEKGERRPIMSAEKMLIQHLLANYKLVGRNGRPVINITTHMDVEFGLGLIQMELDEKEKVLKMSMWSRYKWQDEYLRWNPSDFSNLRKIRIDSDMIWLPDIMLYNSAHPNQEIRDVLAVVSYDGSVLWVPHQVFRSSCSLDVTNFPFDNQKCHMWFGSWTHTRQEVDLKMAFPQGIDLSTFRSDYLESSAWHVDNTSADTKIMPSANDTPNYAVLSFNLTMKRRLVFSSYILTLPCVFLACLTLVVFWLPPDRPDRTSLAMSIFASFLVLLLILVEAAPPTASSVPILGVYYCFNMVIIMLSVFLSSLVVNVYKAGECSRAVPKWLKVVSIDWLARVFFMKSSLMTDDETWEKIMSGHDKTKDPRKKTHKKLLDYGQSKTKRLMEYSQSRNKRLIEYGQSKITYAHYDTKYDIMFGAFNNHKDQETLVNEDIEEMKNCMSKIKGSFLERNEKEQFQQIMINQWRDVALMLDRLFFVVYLIIISISLVFLFPRPK